MARMPTKQDLGTPPVPRSGRGVQRLDTSGYERAAQLQGAGVGAVGEGMKKSAIQMEQAWDQIQSRREALDRLGIREKARDKLAEALEAADSTMDLSNRESIEQIRNQFKGIIESASGGHKGRPDSVVKLRQGLAQDFATYADKAAIRGIEAGNARTNAIAGQTINSFAMRAQLGEDPESLIAEGMSLVGPGTDLGDTMRPGGEANYARLLRESVYLGSIEKLFMSGDDDEVFDMMHDPVVQRSLGVEKQRELFRRLDARARERAEVATAPVNGVPRSVFNALTPEQQLRVIGAAPDEPKIKGLPKSVFDQLSAEEQRQYLGIGPDGSVKGIPRDVWDSLEEDAQNRILGAAPDETTIKGIPADIFAKLTPEEQSRVLGAEAPVVTLGEGEIATQGGKEIARGPESKEKLVEIFSEDSPTKTKFVTESEALGQPGRERTPVISITNQGETALAKKLGEKDAERVVKLEDDAQQAFRTLAEVQRMRAAIESGRFTTGVFSDVRVFLARFASFVGASEETMELLGDAATADTLDAAANRLGVEAAQKLGRITNMSLQFVRDSLPNLARTPEGNLILMEVMERTAEREIKLAGMAEDYIQRYGTLRPENEITYFQAVRDLEEEDPVITEELRQRIIKGSSGPRKTFKERFGEVEKFLGTEGTPTVSTQEDVDKMKPGTEFIWEPTGEPMVKD